MNLGYWEPFGITIEITWTPQRCSSCETSGHTTKICHKGPNKPLKQERKRKEEPKERNPKDISNGLTVQQTKRRK